jgi:PAS domain S-box-containing protein
VNEDALRIIGYKNREEIIGRSCLEPVAESDRERAVRDQIRMLEVGYGAPNEYRFVKKDGSGFYGELRGAVLRDSKGNPAELLGVFRDITQRKQAEQALRESEARSRAILDAMPDLIFQIGRDGVFIDYKGPMEGLYISPGQFIGKCVTEVLPAEVAERTLQNIKNSLDTGRIQQYSYELQIEGKVRYFDVRMASINEKVALALIRDITDRKRMEDALKISEEKLRGIFNSIHDTVALTDLEFTILEVNDAALELSGGMTKEELIGTKAYDFFALEDFAKAMATQPEAVEGRPVPRGEYKLINKLGREIYADVGVSMYRDPSGKTAGFVAVIKDITEHRRMEDALRDSEEKLRVMFSSMADGVVVTDLEGRITDLNAAQLRMFGYKDKKEIVNAAGFDFIAERDRERAFKEIIKVFEEGYNIGAIYAVVDNKGKEFEAELSTAMLHDAVGKPSGLITVMRDVTERRRMEQALRDSEEKLRIIFESIGDGIVVTDLEGIVAECNESAAKIGGWSDKSKLIGMSGFDFVAEQERGKMVADMIKALTEQLSINVEYSVKNKDGREYQSEVNVTLLRDALGNPKGIVSVIRDITERKRMEQDLRDSEEMSRGMLESAATAVCIVKDGKFQYVSPMFAEMTGYTIDELIGTVSTAHIHQNDRDKVMREAVANLKGENIAPHEYRLLRKDGSFIWILEKIASIQYKGERAAIGSLLDITRLKQVEEALRDSEEKLQFIFASIPDGVTVTDLNGIVIEQNEAGIKEIGYGSKDEVIGLNGFDFIAEADRSRAIVDLPQIFEKGVSGPLEYKMLRKDGTEYEGEVTASMMRDKDGNPQGFITVIRNVTERKKAREELKESQEMMRGMLDSAATGIYLVQDGKFEYVNPLFSGISGYAPEELMGSDSMSHIHPDDREVARAKAIENLKGISDLPHEFRFIRKDGQSTWILEKVASIEYKGRRAAIGSFMDISERKRIEEILRQRSRELEQRTNQLLALQQITSAIQSTLDLKEILQQVANGVVHNLGFDHALIIKVDESANVARGMVFATREDASKVNDLQETIGRRLTEIEIPQVRGYSQVVDNSLDGKATITHDFFEVASAILTQDESNAVAELLDAKTIVVMPLFARERHVGSILALTRQEEVGGIFLEPLRILSDQAGFAIENADLYHGVSEFAQRLSVISALSKILGSSLDIKGVYSAFTEEVKKVMNFDRTSIAMVEGDQLRYFVVAEEVDTELKDGAKLPLSDSATGLVVKTKRTIIETDFDQEMKFPIDHMYYRSGLRSAIRVPLFSKGDVFATFNLASRKPNAYGEREREILEQISGSLTAAMENSRLFDQVKQHEAELLKAYEDLKSAQAYMVQAEKLRALGEMAGGVAHDFNNVLAVVLGRTQLALEDVKDEKLRKDLKIIEQTAIDAATTVRRLQDFARVRVERNFEVLDLNEVVESALQMVESRRVKLKEREGINIDVESKLRDTATVEGDAAELREGLLNIIFNAMDAMPKGGKIKIESRQTKKWVTIAISDTGIGIPEDIRTKIFEPFFTTRTHKGTGLGLSVTYSIIQRHRGEITVESTVGVGSTFYIKLPLCEGVVSKKHAAGKADAVKSVSILMVDDNPEVAGILGLTLRRLGHIVVEANSGEAAINTFEVGKFDLVITDLGMPDMSGHEVAKIVKEIKPGTPVLVISGWGGQLNLDEMPEVDGVIAKPFSKDVLSEKIAAVLSCEGAQARDLKQKATKAKKTGKSDKTDKSLTGKEEKPKKRKSADKKE